MVHTNRTNILITSAIWIASLLAGVQLVFGPFGMDHSRSLMDLLYLGLLLGHAVYAGVVYRTSTLRATRIDLLFAITTVLFLFSYIFASNANMDYVQRFAEGKTYLNFGPDSRVERWNSLLRYLPFLCVDGIVTIWYRLRHRGTGSPPDGPSGLPDGPSTLLKTVDRIVRLFALPLVLLSALVSALSFPSFLSVRGWGVLAFVGMVPLFLVLLRSREKAGVMYGTLFGIVFTMITSYWLGTFSLVTLQFVTVIYTLLYAAFMAVTMWVIRRRGERALILLPFLWIAFDLLRSTGFIGYPWGMIGTTQYRFLPFIQIAELTGVWGVSLAVLMINAALTDLLLRGKRALRFASIVAISILVMTGIGALRMHRIDSVAAGGETTRIALVQQNSDPRKNDYRATYNVLRTLTDDVLQQDPSLVVWSETAFVVNLRRWSKEDPAKYPYAALAHDFLAYQKGLKTWLLTGNDDYSLFMDENGDEERLDYNGSVLFDDRGVRRKTYHKLHLVPFTEYFPWKKSLPWAYEGLKKFDVYLWEPGSDRVVFNHPEFTFSTPICFEDSFPRDVRLFVRDGAQLIINISNDYWSLREAEAQQHFANALFRAVENRRPLLRASASGVTSFVDATGRLVARLPNYTEGAIVVEPSLARMPDTIYTKLGDWLPWIVIVFLPLSLFRKKKKPPTPLE